MDILLIHSNARIYMRHCLSTFVVCVTMMACTGKTESTDSPTADTTRVVEGSNQVKATGASASTPVPLPDGLITQAQALVLCFTDGMEKTATPSVSDAGAITGLNELLQIAPSVGGGTVSDATTSKVGFEFVLRFANGNAYKSTLGGGGLSITAGPGAKAITCTDVYPEAGGA